MKVFVLAAAALLVSGVSFPAMADTPGADWMTKEKVTQRLEGMGYTDVRKLEADGGHWEGDAAKDGVSYEIHVAPHSGEVTKSEPKHENKGDHDDDD